VEKKPLRGKMLPQETGQLSYQIFEAEAGLVFPVARRIEENFGFAAPNPPLYQLDEIYIELWQDDLHITVGWDTWNGCFVIGATDAENEVVQAIGEYLETQLKNL
jgi:hypothetical protein